MDLVTIILFVAGLVLLVAGAELLVSGASDLAKRFGMSPLVVGLTVVSFGTSAPELAVTIQAVWTDDPGVGVGNVVGSAVFNVLVILGLSAIVAPLLVSRALLVRDGPIMIASALLLLALVRDRDLSRLDGIILTAILVGYLTWLIKRGSAEEEEPEEDELPESALLGDLLRLIGGLAMLVLGANWLVNGAVSMADALGLSEVVVGLTIVAAGTGLPEVATSLLAAIRGQRDIAVGSAVGSNIFNILAVLGISSLVSPASIPIPGSAAQFDIPVFIAVAFASVLAFATGYQVSRWEGGLFLTYYAMYTAYLVLEAIDHSAFGWIQVTGIVVGLAGLALLTIRAVQARLLGQEVPA